METAEKRDGWLPMWNRQISGEGASEVLHKSYCRHCQSLCGLVVEVENNRVTSIRGDREHPVSQGYSCMMGQHSLLAQDEPQRLTMAQRRAPDGAFAAMPVDQAVREVGEKLKALIDRHGPRSVALYYGTGTAYSGLAYGFAKSWLRAIGSPELYTSMTLDASSLYVCMKRMGAFATGRPLATDCDTLLLVGNNPVVSHQGWSKSPLPSSNPRKAIAEAQAQGTKLIVIDPRLTETARKADLFLQVKPGEDCTLLAAILRVMLERGWTDPTFHDRFCTSLPALRSALAPFDLACAESRTGVPAKLIEEAARLFGTAGKAHAACGTGLSFGPHSNLAEHLLECLNALCGGYRRAGDTIRTTGLFGNAQAVEKVIPPNRDWLTGPMLRSVTTGRLNGEFPSSRLPDEILHPGEDRIRALIAFGGNPATAISGTAKTVEALRSLELLVSIDPRWSPTGRLAHYVIPTKLPLEREDLNISLDGASPLPWVNYAPAVVEPPVGVPDDWDVFYDLARHMGVGIEFKTGPFGRQLEPGLQLDMVNRPTTAELIAHACKVAGVSYEDLAANPGGMWLSGREAVVQPAPDDDGARLDLCPEDVAGEIAQVYGQGQRPVDPAFPLMLISRRVARVMNATFHELPATEEKYPVAPLFMHPGDAAARNLEPGAIVAIASPEARITGQLVVDDTLVPGVVSMPMGWGSTEPGDPHSTLTSQLISLDREVEAINFMPRQTAIPVEVY